MYAESHEDYLFQLHCLQRAAAKKRFRQEILEAWNHQCCYCGNEANTIDHIRAKALGGTSFRRNLAACCRRCNKSKATEDVWTWYRSQSFYSVEREDFIRRWVEQ